MKEQIIQFGPAQRLMGLLTLPPPAFASDGTPALLIPNTGVEHRVGPHRLHVQIARALAEAGFPVLRLDLAGMGDSSVPPGGQKSDAVQDLRAAMDHLQRLGVAQRFGVIGLCSGADDAHRVSLADSRVMAAAFIDHHTYPTSRFQRNYWKERMFDAKRIRNFLRRRFGGPPAGASEKDQFRADQLDYFDKPAVEAFSEHLQQFVSRQMALYFLYTGEVLADYNYREQLTDAFPVLRGYPRLALHFAPQADHTFSQVAMRRELIAGLLDWTRQHLPSAAWAAKTQS